MERFLRTFKKEKKSDPLLMQILRSCFDSFLIADTLPFRSVRPLDRDVTFLNSERFSHYCSCPTVRDWIAVYLALFYYNFLILEKFPFI